MKNERLSIKKSNSGITLISLVVAIIVLIILASVGVNTGITSINSAKLTQFTTQMKIMQIEVNELFEKSRSEETVKLKDGTEFTGAEIIDGNEDGKKIGKDLNEANSTQISQVFKIAGENGSDIIDTEGYRFFDVDTIELLQIDGVDQEFLVNIETRTVISYKGLKYYDNLYYTLEQLPDSLYNVSYTDPNTGAPTFDVNYERVANGKYKINVTNIKYETGKDGYIGKWEVKYQKSDTENTEKWYTSESTSFVVDDVGLYKIYISQNGVQSGVKEIHVRYSKTEVIAEDIANNPKEYYGSVVSNYKVDSSVEDNNIQWKIFHADDNNIYLIASDYIQIANAPSKTVNGTTYSLNTGNNEYTGYFANIRRSGAYSGSANITDSRIKQLNNSYFNEANNGLGYTSTSSNMICVAYMLDIDICNRYAMAGKSEYAIGAPTIELLLDSYNNKYSTNYLTEAVSANGYQISKDNGENWEITCTGILEKDDDLYIVNKGSKIDALWLASPSGDTELSNRMVSLDSDGSVSRKTYGDEIVGFRPIVCLKSDVHLKEQPDGTYKITDVL